jgi:hypothetical protein
MPSPGVLPSNTKAWIPSASSAAAFSGERVVPPIQSNRSLTLSMKAADE